MQSFTTSIYVTDQERAKRFYTEVLGFTIDRDQQLSESFRWLSVAPPGQPDQIIALFSADDAGVGVDERTGREMARLVEAGAFSAGALFTDDCEAFCARLRAQGVSFLVEPEERPWGVIEALVRDDSGNRIAIVERLRRER